MISLAVLIASFNRRDTTLRCLERLSSQVGLDDIDLRIFLVDDASSDGTAFAVRQRFPDVNVLDGTGDLYWTGGMLMADAAAWNTRPNLMLWLNDDVDLFANALRDLVDAVIETDFSAIVVGAVCDPETGTTTYGGYGRPDSRQPLKIQRVEPSGKLETIDTMNGNVVAIPRSVREAIGTLDGRFSHNMADMDYGYRASRAGLPLVLAPRFVGSCPLNSAKSKWNDPSVPLRGRWAAIKSVRGLPPREWLEFTRRYYGRRWPRYFVSPYVRCVACGVLARRKPS